MARAEQGGLRVWLRAGATRWHAHADLCSVAVRLGDEWVFGDPGTGSYNGDDAERSWFRSSSAHSVLELDGREQVLAHRTFRWQTDPWCAIGPPIHHESTTILWGAHRAYGVPVARAVIVRPDDIAILDVVSPAEPRSRPYAVRFALAPTAAWTDAGEIRLASGRTVRLHLPPRAEITAEPSRWSPTYGRVVPATMVVARGVEHGPLLSTMSREGRLNWQLRGHALHDGGTRVAFTWRGTVIALHLSSPTGSFTRELRTPP